VILAVLPTAVLVPCTMIGALAADASLGSRQRPDANVLVVSPSSRPSMDAVAGTVLNQVGGSIIAVSWAGNEPTIGLAAPPVFVQ
jgi:hypothetical protein